VSLDQFLPPRVTFNDFHQRCEEIRSEPTVGHAVIHRERELGHRPYLQAAVDGHNAVPLAAHGENR
jgi:hypothetical protein